MFQEEFSRIKPYASGFRSLILTAVLLGASAAAWATEDEVGEPGSASVQPSENLCFGGLEDGKFIVSEPYLKNPYRETTRLGCEVDGGAPVTMPDLPAPDAAKHRMA